jgi:hypothetical protein
LRSGRRLETGRLSYILQRTSKIEQKTQEGKFIIESKLVRETNKKERTQLQISVLSKLSYLYVRLHDQSFAIKNNCNDSFSNRGRI